MLERGEVLTVQIIVTAMHGGCNYFAVQVHYFTSKIMTLVVTIQSIARRWTGSIAVCKLCIVLCSCGTVYNETIYLMVPQHHVSMIN